jgi:hypothetical protein
MVKCADDLCSSRTTDTLDWSGDVGYNTDIAVDSRNAAFISYYDQTNTKVKLYVENTVAAVTVAAVTPDNAPTTGGDSITVTGTGFTAGSTVDH